MKDKKRERTGNQFALKVTVIALLILFAAAFVYFSPMVSLLQWDEQKLEIWVDSLGVFAPLATIGLMVLHSFLPVPGEIVAVLNGMIFGPVWGVIYTWIGAMLGAYLSFFLSRKWGQRMQRRFRGQRRRREYMVVSGARRSAAHCFYFRLGEEERAKECQSRKRCIVKSIGKQVKADTSTDCCCNPDRD